MNKLKKWVMELLKIVKAPSMKILPGNLAFFLVLSIVPVVTLIGYIASGAGISIDSLIHFLGSSLPKEINDILLPFISGDGIDTNVVIFMVIGFFLASNGPQSIIIASNTLFELDSSPYIKQRIKAIFMTIIMMILFFFMIIVLGFGNVIVKSILNLKIFSFITHSAYMWFKFLKWPIAFVLVFYMLKVIYTLAIDQKISSKYMNRGALFTTICVMLATFIYSYYVSNFANYDLFYGSLSNIMILMVWIYIISYVMVLGIAINAKTYKERINKDKK